MALTGIPHKQALERIGLELNITSDLILQFDVNYYFFKQELLRI
jgi:outer membrane protein W